MSMNIIGRQSFRLWSNCLAFGRWVAKSLLPNTYRNICSRKGINNKKKSQVQPKLESYRTNLSLKIAVNFYEELELSQLAILAPLLLELQPILLFSLSLLSAVVFSSVPPDLSLPCSHFPSDGALQPQLAACVLFPDLECCNHLKSLINKSCSSPSLWHWFGFGSNQGIPFFFWNSMLLYFFICSDKQA